MDHLGLESSRYVTLVPASRRLCEKLIGAGQYRFARSKQWLPKCIPYRCSEGSKYAE